MDSNGEKKEVVVETGIETEYYIEVSSDEISEGQTVYLSTPLLKSQGEGENASSGSTESVMTFNMGGGGGAPGGSGGGPGGGAPGGF